MEQSSVKNYSSTTAAVKVPYVQFQISAEVAGNWNSGVETHPLRKGRWRGLMAAAMWAGAPQERSLRLKKVVAVRSVFNGASFSVKLNLTLTSEP